MITDEFAARSMVILLHATCPTVDRHDEPPFSPGDPSIEKPCIPVNVPVDVTRKAFRGSVICRKAGYRYAAA